MSLDHFFNPKSVAIIGASRFPRKFGHIVFENFLDSDFQGNVYPVNPNAERIMGEQCYKSILDIPDKIDLAVIVIPANLVLDAVKDCVKKKVKACIILSAGFSEIGNISAEERILKAKGKMRIIGPNVIGIYDSYSKVDTIFNPRYRQERPPKGNIAFISQSGAFGAAIMDWCASEGIGLSKFISIGNRIDVDEVDLLEYLANDKKTNVITMYIEGTKRGKMLLKTLKKVTKKKPVIAIKAGRTTEGSKAVSSHTGTLAGDVEIYSAAFKQAGVIEARNIEELFDFAKALAHQPIPKNDRICIVTNGGGFGVLCADAIIENKLRLARLDKKTINEIKKHCPDYTIISNPMDLVGDANSERYRIALENVMKDKNVDGVIVTLLMQISSLESDVVDVLIKIKEEFKKPMLVCSTGGEFTNLHKKLLEKEGIATYPTPERAVKTMKTLVDYSRSKRKSN